jgi:hypothetical protein
MAVVKKTNIEIGAGVNLDGSRKTVSYPIETHDNSGVNNDALFNGTVVEPTVDPEQNNWTPHGMNEPKPPRGKGE